MAQYVIKNNNLYYHSEILKDSFWVEEISNATIFDDNQIDQNCVPSYCYVIDGLNRYEGFPDAKVIEVERFYREKLEP
jgi:hypothetical protein